MNNVSFQGKNNVNLVLREMKYLKNPKQLSQAQASIEQLNGLAYGMTHTNAEAKETIMRESMLGNFDFVKGVNEALSKDASKKLYK